MDDIEYIKVQSSFETFSINKRPGVPMKTLVVQDAIGHARLNQK